MCSSSISPTLKLAFVGDENINLVSLLTAEGHQSNGKCYRVIYISMFIALISYIDLAIIVVHKTMWCFTKANSMMTINFNVWNFVNQVIYSDRNGSVKNVHNFYL